MKQFNDPEDDKILLDRKEFMRFWSKEFDQQIKDAPLSKEMVQLQHLIDVLKNSSTNSALHSNDIKCAVFDVTTIIANCTNAFTDTELRYSKC